MGALMRLAGSGEHGIGGDRLSTADAALYHPLRRVSSGQNGKIAAETTVKPPFERRIRRGRL
jgi:hypothetical protein